MANNANESTKWLYEQLKGKGYNVGKDVDEFDNLMRTNADSRQWAYDTAKKSGLNVGKDIDEFSSLVSPVKQKVDLEDAAFVPSPTPEIEKESVPNNVSPLPSRPQDVVNAFNSNTQSMTDRAKNMSEYMRHGESLTGGVVKGRPKLNPKNGNLEPAYLTPTGVVTRDKSAAEQISSAYRKAAGNMTLNGQLRNERNKLKELSEKRRKLTVELSDAPVKTEGGFFANIGYNKAQVDKAAIDNNDDIKALDLAIRQTHERIAKLQRQSEEKGGKDIGFWRGITDVVTDLKTWDMGISEAQDAATMLKISKKKGNGDKTTEAEESALEAIYDNQNTPDVDNFWFRAGTMTGEMLPFMLDFAMMGGSGSGSTIATRNLSAMLLRSLHKTAPKAARKKAVQWTTKVLGAMPEDLLIKAPIMTNTVQAGKTVSDIIDRKLGNVILKDDGTYDFSNDKTWGSAVWQGEANAIIENYSEMFGTHLEGALSLKTLGKLADTFGAKRLSGLLAKASNSDLSGIVGTMQKHLNQLGVSDYIGEVGEEYYGQLWRTMLNLDDAYKQNPDGSRTNLFLDGQFHGDIWGGMALSMGLMGAGKYSVSAAAYGSMKHRVNKTDARASEIFTSEIWEDWRERIDGTTNDNIGVMSENILADQSLTEEQKTAAMNYMEASLNLRGFNLASIARQRGSETSEEEAALNESYMDGYSATTPEEMNDAKRLMELHQQRLASSLSEDVIPEFDSDPIGALSRTHDPELRRIASDYVNAKQVYEGMIQRVRDDVDGRIAQSDAMIDSHVNRETGMIQPATMKIDNRQVYILNGSVSMFDDGSGVDAQNSSESIIIRDAETGKIEFVDPTQFLSIDNGIDAEAEKESARSQIIEEIARTAANNIDGILPFNAGDSYSILDLEGNQQSVSILGLPSDENGIPMEGYVDIQYPDGNIETVATSDLQQWVDDAREQRIAQFEQERQAENDDKSNVPNGKETVPNPDENIDLDTENGQNAVPTIENDIMSPSSEVVSSALSQIPVDTNGEPAYEQAEPDLAWDALLEQTEGDENIAQSVIEQTIAEKERELKKIAKQKAKSGLSTTQKIQAEKDKKKSMDVIQQSIDHWKRMGTTIQRRQAEEEARRTAEAHRLAEESRIKAERERAEREEAERIEREALNGIPDWSRDTPQDARARGYRRNGPQKVDRQGSIPAITGKEVEVKFGENKLPKGHIAIIDASKLQPSHIQGSRNPLHFLDEAQPKERDDAASVLSAQKIASNIRPEEITSSVTAYTGAPSVNLRGETIQGNSRSDALRLMYEKQPEEATKYKQYITDHAADFGLTAEQIALVEHPVLVNMLDVADEEAIRLGQFVAQDTESGGIERIKPKNAVQRMGNRIRSFANILLRTSDDEASLSQLIESNGAETLEWMSRNGFITDTQYGSAFDSKGQLSPKASEDLKGILYQSIFTGGSTRLEEMFNTLPAKAQRAILATAFRDYDSAKRDRMVGEAQQSIIAFYDLSSYAPFAEATNLSSAMAAAETWKNQYAMDDVTGESYLPAENFSNFAMYLAALYKGGTQKFIQQVFNDLFDAIQGTAQDTLFEEADKTPKSLADAIKKVLELEYKPIIKTEYENNRSNAVDINTPQSETGRPGSNGDVASGEREADSPESTDSGRGAVESDPGRGKQGNRQPNRERQGDLPATETGNINYRLSNEVDENGRQFVLNSKGELEFGRIGAETGLTSAPILLSEGIITNPTTNDGYGLLHIEARHGAEIRKAGYSSALAFIEDVANRWEVIKEAKDRNGNQTYRLIAQGKHNHTLMVELSGDGTYWNINTAGVFKTSYGKNQKEVYVRHTTDKHPAEDVGESQNSAQSGTTENSRMNSPTLNMSGDKPQTAAFQPHGLVSDSKVTNSASDKQEVKSESSIGEQIATAEAEVNTDPTDKQKEAGNYKKGHVQVGTFDVSIENPKGSVRRGTDADGKQWETTMTHTYGYIRGTKGVDGDHIDVYISSYVDDWNGRKVFVVDQYNPDGSFDEHKVMLGFNDKEEAFDAYLSNYEAGWESGRRLDVTAVNLEDFEKWIESSKRKTKPFAEYKNVNRAPESITPQYSITSKPYTNKQGKTLDTYLVTFDRDFSKQEKATLRTMVKDKKGWYDRESGGWMLRSREEAETFAKTVIGKKDSQLSEEAPLSLDDMKNTSRISEESLPNTNAYSEIISNDDLEKLDEGQRKQLIDYISKYPCAPLVVITNDEDINKLDMDAELRSELKELYHDSENAALHNEETGKIYIFANRKDITLHETLVHENVHSVVASLGEDKIDFLSAFTNTVSVLPNFNGQFGKLLEGIKDFYPQEKHTEEFLAYVIQYSTRSPKVMKVISRALDVETENYLKTKIIHKLYGTHEGTSKENAGARMDSPSSGITSKDNEAIRRDGRDDERGGRSDQQKESGRNEVQREREIGISGLEDTTPPSDNTQNNPSGNKLVTDEQYAELLAKMRKKMGGQLNMGVDPEILAIGSMMAVYHIEKGARKFAEYVKVMIADLGEKFPARYLKGFYKAAHEMIEDIAPEIAEEMDSDEIVNSADVATIIHGHVDAMATAELIVEEEDAEKEQKEAEQKLKTDRNTKKSKKKTVSSQNEQPGLFGGLFDEDVTPTGNDIRRNDAVSTERLPSDNRGQSEGDRENPGAQSQGTRQGSERTDRAREESGAERTRTVRPRLSRLTEEERRNTRNNRAERGTDYAPKGEDARIKANIAAIELAQRLTENGEQATPEQMEILRKFSGWGGLGKAFSNDAYADRIRKLLGGSYQDAVDSRKSAYYTPAAIIDSLWDIAKAMGFQGGTILEGSAGIGNILGLMPEEISERSNVRAVEVDSTTGSILSLLYPDAQVDIQGFEETQIENGSVDLAITNVPFITGWNVIDKTGDKDLSKKFKDIHDFCIAKNIRKLREGGIGIFITSSGTLDNSAKLRAWVTNEGNSDVVGAFRLHNETFGGTGATSDIIVVRKRVNGKKSAHAIDVSEVSGVRTAEYDTGETKKVKVDGHKQEVPVVDVVTMGYNRYFIEHPEQMAGEMHFGFEKGDTYRAKSKALYPVKGMNQEAMLSAWAHSFSDMDFDATPTNKNEYETTYDTVGNEIKVGSMVIDDHGRLCVNTGGLARPLMSARKNKQDTRPDDELIFTFNSKKIKGRTRQQCLKDYNGIKKALADVLEYQTTHDDNDGLEPLLSRLNATFDSFVSRYGNLHKNNQLAWLKNDVDFPGILALETYEERGDERGNRIKKFGKTDIFSRRVVEKETIPQPKNVKDGIITSLYISGRVDVAYISEQLNMSEERLRKEIVSSGLGFENPVSREMEVSYEYLSGNVREKLRQAIANNTDGKYDANIRALEKVVPMNIPAHLIEFALGSSWIEPQLYEDYVKERTGVNVKLTNVGGTWFMKVSDSDLNSELNRSQGVYSEELKKTVFGHEILEAAITNRSISVSRTSKHSDGTSETITDRDATQAVAAKVDEFRVDFKDWARAKMQADMEMSTRMETVYNDRFNNSVPRSIPNEFIPKHFGGQVTEMGSKPFSLRPHQAKAVIRGTTQSQLLAHEVGTGKTFTLISTAMEMRRLGTARKPMIVVQNATVGQFVESAKALYPNAKVLTLEDADRNAQGRKDFYAKIRYNDWDMIVIPQSVLDMIPDSEERQIRFIQDKIAEKMLVLQQMAEQDPDGSSWITKQAEKEISDLENDLAKITESLESKRKEDSEKDMKKEAQTRHNAEVRAMEMLDRVTDDVENFDQMGIDALLVDEAHEYKHLGFATAMQRGVKGVDPSYSKKAQGLYLKTQAVMERNNGRNVIFATGTPISNTAAEIWTFMRYLMPEDEMRDYGIYYFDDFVRNFGNLQQMLEFATNGKFKENNRFAGYVNLPELVRIWSTVTDTVLTREAGGVSDKIPDMDGGKAQDIYLPQTKALRSVMLYVKSELDRYDKMTGKEKKANSHIPLTMYGIAKAAAVDARLVYSDAADEPQSKTNEGVRQTLRSLEETSDYKGTIAIFADNYQNKQSGFNLYEDIRRKLIEQGVPAEQIVVMKSGMTVKKKLEIFDKVNAGEVRVILGSTYTLGTGVNIQERLHTLIHLDAPNRPMDYTQRNGRILRQGNLHKDMGIPVRILRFGVEDSLDVTAYQRLKTKGAIADSIMNGTKMMENSMETRSLEEDEDVFGDITAQLSGSEYAMLKNQAEKEVRKLNSKLKQWEADQTYIHNQIPRLKGQIREREKQLRVAQTNLDTVHRLFPNGTYKAITIGKQSFPDLESMSKLFTEHNKNVMDVSDQIRDNKIEGPQTRRLTIDIDGMTFEVTTIIDKEMGNNGGSLFSKASRKITYSCPQLQEVSDIPVSGARLKGAIEDIVSNIITGKDYAERVEAMQSGINRNQTELQQIEQRQGKEFEFYSELAEAKQRLEEYTEKMKAELAEKEAKYANMDAGIETASDISLSEEDSERTEEDDNTRYRLDDEPTTVAEIDETVHDNLLAPNGKPSNLTEKQWKQVRTPEFKKWFGDWENDPENSSKLLDENGEPLVVYHGTVNDFWTFQHGMEKIPGIKSDQQGFYFATREGASRYNDHGTDTGINRLIPCFLNIRNPYWTDSHNVVMDTSRFILDITGIDKEYDGIILKAGETYNENSEIAVWDATQIKSAVVNNGQFSPTDSDIRHRMGQDAYNDAELAMSNDPWSKAWGESIRTKRQQERYAERERNRMRERAKSLSSILGVDIEIIEDASVLKGKKQKAKGWYDTKSGKITVVISNHKSAADMEATILHEAVAHHGLRQLLGKHFDEFLSKVYEAAGNNIKEQIDLLATRNGWNRGVATEEYLASLAEQTDFDNAEERVGGWFDKVKRFFFDMLFKAGFKHILPNSIGDNELRYILWRSYQNLANPGRYRAFLWEAEDVAMQYQLKVGEYAESKPVTKERVAEDASLLYRDGDFTPRDRKMVAHIYENMLANGSYQFREATQDSMLGLKKLYEAILGNNLRIEDVAGYENAYLYENRMSSANNGEQHQYFVQHMKPLLESVYKLCGQNELDRRILTDYMIAKHGLERNAYMRNEAMQNGEDTERDFAGLCGLTGESDWQVAETVAQQMVDDYEADHDTTELWNNVKKSTSATLEKIYLSGMISEDTYNQVSGMYEYYIPLRGWDQTTSDEVYGYLTSKGGPLLGNVFKSAEGRSSKADDPIATIAMMADDAIRQGNRNIMKQRFLNFTHNNPSNLVSVTELWLQYNDVTDEWVPVFADLEPDMTHEEVENELKKFEARMEALKNSEPDKYKRGRSAQNIPYKVVRANLNEHQVLVKRNGRTYIMTINGNPRAAQALNGLTNPDVEMGGVVGNLLKLGEYVNRNLSAFYTTRNPDFVVSNFLRDMLYSNCMTWVKENPRYALRFHKNIGKVNPVILRRLLSKWENGKLNDGNYLEKMFKEFMLNGGETGYTSVRDIEEHKRSIASELKKQGSAGRKAWSALCLQLDLLNRSAENCARFAAFLTSREMGRTLDRSIHDAKEISVNFNKKGSGGKFVNATGQKFLGKVGAYLGGGGRIAFVFWNAGIQGMTNFGRAGKRNPVKALTGAAALFSLGIVIPMLAQMMGGGDGDDDDKNAYYNLPEYVRRSNICFKAGEQWITIPLPVEYRSIYGMGELACGVISGNERYSNSELARQMAAQISQALPLDMLEGGGGFSPLIPSALKPMTEAYIMNKGWTGLPVYKDTPYNKNDPEWTKAYQSADQHLVAFTRWLNETSGGNDYKKGAIDINPAKLEYLISGTFGGVVSTAGKLKKMGETTAGIREFEWRNMLLANRIIKSGDERTANRKLLNEYFKYSDEYEETKRLLKKYENAADNGILGYAERADFLYNSPEYLRFEIFEEYKPDIDAIRQELKEESDHTVKKELEKEQYATMRELINELHGISK